MLDVLYVAACELDHCLLVVVLIFERLTGRRACMHAAPRDAQRNKAGEWVRTLADSHPERKTANAAKRFGNVELIIGLSVRIYSIFLS